MYRTQLGSFTLNPRVSNIAVPILAQRLLINLRKADWMGARSYVSSLLFAPAIPESREDRLDGDPGDLTEGPPPVDHGVMDDQQSGGARMRTGEASLLV